jgi:hypothetical protein
MNTELRDALRAFLHWHDNAPCDGIVLAQAVLMAREALARRDDVEQSALDH